VTGRVAVTAPSPDRPARRREARVFTAHTGLPEERPAAIGDDPVRWFPYRQVASEAAYLGIPELALFLEGYVDGWIPDGWITLG
jgi:hypothetical protein